MPIIDVQCLLREGQFRYGHESVQALADALGDLFGSEPAGTWVRMRYLDEYDYAESHTRLGPTVDPTFVTILRRQNPEAADLASEAMAVAEAVGRVLARPRENVHVIYEPEATGRVAFGGTLVN